MNPGQSSDPDKRHSREHRSTRSVVEKHLREIAQIARDPEHSRDSVRALVKALQATSEPNPSVVEVAKDVELRRSIGLAIGSTELEHHDYTLERVSDFVFRHGDFVNVILTNRELGARLGPALLAPMLFDRFQPGRDTETLETTANKLRLCLSKSALEVWESIVARSVIWAYEDPVLSPCPFAYQNALGFRDPMVRSLESSDDEQQLVALVGALSIQGFSVPTSLWKVCAEEVREDIARIVPLTSMLSCFKDLLKATRDQSKQLLSELRHIAKSNRYTDAGEVNDAEEIIDGKFSRLLEDLSKSISFFREFIHIKEQEILLDPIHHQLAPRLLSQRADYNQNPATYYEARFIEYLQKALGADLISMVKSVSKFFANDRSFVPVTKEFVCALSGLIDQCGIFLDDEISAKKDQQSFYDKHLLPAFFKYVGRGDIESAHQIRLLFPESSCECIQCNRYPIDDAIAEHQGVIADGMFRAAKRIAVKAPRWLYAEDVKKQASIENDILTYRNALTVFVHNTKNAPIEERFVDGMAAVAFSLVKADVVKNQKYYNGETPITQNGESLPALFKGAEGIAGLLRVFEHQPAIRLECMARMCRASSVDVSGYVSNFIASANDQFVRSLQLMKSTGASLQSIERECENIFAAETLYLSMPKVNRDDLPVPISRYLRMEMRLGFGVLQTQHRLHPEASHGIGQPLNARRLQLWSEGLIGERASPLRREFLNQFFRQLRAERRVIPKELQPLVFDALEQFAKGFIENINQDSLDADFRDGLVVILGGFLLSSHEMQGTRRMELGRVLSRVFVNRRSQEFCPDYVSHTNVAAAFRELIFDTLYADEQGAMKKFMNSTAVTGILTHLGLLDRFDRVDPIA